LQLLQELYIENTSKCLSWLMEISVLVLSIDSVSGGLLTDLLSLDEL
jgi:hypothetical protein